MGGWGMVWSKHERCWAGLDGERGGNGFSKGIMEEKGRYVSL